MSTSAATVKLIGTDTPEVHDVFKQLWYAYVREMAKPRKESLSREIRNELMKLSWDDGTRYCGRRAGERARDVMNMQRDLYLNHPDLMPNDLLELLNAVNDKIISESDEIMMTTPAEKYTWQREEIDRVIAAINDLEDIVADESLLDNVGMPKFKITNANSKQILNVIRGSIFVLTGLVLKKADNKRENIKKGIDEMPDPELIQKAFRQGYLAEAAGIVTGVFPAINQLRADLDDENIDVSVAIGNCISSILDIIESRYLKQFAAAMIGLRERVNRKRKEEKKSNPKAKVIFKKKEEKAKAEKETKTAAGSFLKEFVSTIKGPKVKVDTENPVDKDPVVVKVQDKKETEDTAKKIAEKKKSEAEGKDKKDEGKEKAEKKAPKFKIDGSDKKETVEKTEGNPTPMVIVKEDESHPVTDPFPSQPIQVEAVEAMAQYMAQQQNRDPSEFMPPAPQGPVMVPHIPDPSDQPIHFDQAKPISVKAKPEFMVQAAKESKTVPSAAQEKIIELTMENVPDRVRPYLEKYPWTIKILNIAMRKGLGMYVIPEIGSDGKVKMFTFTTINQNGGVNDDKSFQVDLGQVINRDYGLWPSFKNGAPAPLEMCDQCFRFYKRDKSKNIEGVNFEFIEKLLDVGFSGLNKADKKSVGNLYSATTLENNKYIVLITLPRDKDMLEFYRAAATKTVAVIKDFAKMNVNDPEMGDLDLTQYRFTVKDFDSEKGTITFTNENVPRYFMRNTGVPNQIVEIDVAPIIKEVQDDGTVVIESDSDKKPNFTMQVKRRIR